MLNIAKVLVFFVLSAFASAQSSNNALAVSAPGYGDRITAGESYTIKWDSSSSVSSVNLVLMSGQSTDLKEVATIASGVSDSGSYTWQVPADTYTGAAYTIRISSSSDSTIENYSYYFAIIGSSDGASSSSGSSSSVSASASSTSASSSASSSVSATSGSATVASSSSSGTATSSGSKTTSASASTSASSHSSTASSASSRSSSSSPASASSSSSAASKNGSSLIGVSVSNLLLTFAAYIW